MRTIRDALVESFRLNYDLWTKDLPKAWKHTPVITQAIIIFAVTTTISVITLLELLLFRLPT